MDNKFMDTTQTQNNIQFDKQALDLAHAIALSESAGKDGSPNYNAKGVSGEHGAYQWMPGNYENAARKYGFDPNDFSPTTQDKVAYHQVKEYKDKGYLPHEIASLWNSGSSHNYQNHSGINKEGVAYDTPTYVNKVKQNYQKLLGVSQNEQNNSVPDTITHSEQPKKDLLQKTGDVVNTIFPGKETGQAIGTLGGLAFEKIKGLFGGQDNSKFYDTSAPTPLQVAGDVAQGALTVAPGLGAVKAFGKTIPALKTASSVGGRIGQSGLLGAGFGATGALKEGSTNIGDIGKRTLTGGLVGGALGSIGEAISTIANHFPKTMIQGKFEGLSDAEAEKFLQQKIGTQESLLNQAQKVIETEGNKIDDVLQKFIPTKVSTANPFIETLQQFPEFQGREGQLVTKIKSFVSNTSNIGEERSTILKYIDKIVNGKASLFEKNQVRKILDLATKGGYAKLAKAIAPSAGHDLAMTFADSLRNEIQSTVKETIPMFRELQKSLNIRNAIRKLANKKSGGLIRYSDIIPFLGGNAIAPGLGIGALVANRAAQNPAMRFAGAKVSKGLLSGSGTLTKSPLTMKAIEGLFGGNVNVRK